MGYTEDELAKLKRAAEIVGWTVAEVVKIGGLAQADSIIEEAEQWAADDAAENP